MRVIGVFCPFIGKIQPAEPSYDRSIIRFVFVQENELCIENHSHSNPPA